MTVHGYIFPLGTDQRTKTDPRHRLREWADQDHKRRRRWLKSMLDAARDAGAEDIWLAAPNGTHGEVALESEQTLRLDDRRYDDLGWACDSYQNGDCDLGLMDGFGWLDKPRAFFFDPGGFPTGNGWRIPMFTVPSDRRRVERGWESTAALGFGKLILDQLSTANKLTGEGWRWARFGSALTGMTVVGEGVGLSKISNRVLWGWQIDQFPEEQPSLIADSYCVIDGHTQIELGGEEKCVTPADMRRAAQRFKDAGWTIIYSAASPERIREIALLENGQ